MRFQIGQVFKALSNCSTCSHSARVVDSVLICGKTNEAVRLFDASYDCPAGLWTSEASNSRAYLKVGSAPGPMSIESIKHVWAMAAGFVKTATSGFATDSTVDARTTSCLSCEYRKQNDDGEAFCDACGCPEWRFSKLDIKLKFKELPCPHPHGGRPGFSNHSG